MTLAAALLAASVAIDPGAYGGRYYIDTPARGPFTGKMTHELTPGSHWLDMGSFIAGSGFSFSVGSSDQVSDILPASAAAATASGLRLNSVTVPVDASGYQGAWGLSAYMPALTTGSRTFTLVPGIAYSLDAGSFVAGSAFTFTVTATGQVAAISPAGAAAGGATLKFNLANVTIDPGKYTASYAVFSHALVAGIRTFSLLKDLVFGIDNGSYLAGSTIYVKLGPTGLVASEITPAGAASGNGSTLSFANVQVAVDPHAYAGAYSVGSYAPAAGLATFFLVPGLVSHLSAQGQAAPFTPSAAQVTPSSITLSAGTFSFSPVTAATAPRFAALVAAQIAAYVAAGQIDPAAGAFLSLLFSTAAGLAATQPAVARALLGAFVLATNLGAAAGLISPAAQSALLRDAQALLSILP